MSKNNSLKVSFVKKIYIYSQTAEPTPPLGTILGNLGVNTSLFCTQFNQFTKTLPNYYKVNTLIYIYENKSFSFEIFMPSISSILRMLKISKTIKVFEGNVFIDKIVFYVDFYSIIKLANLKFKGLPLIKSISVLLGILKSMSLKLDF